MLRRIVNGRSKVTLLTLGSIALYLATMLVNIGSFAFHLLTSRQLPPGEYGALGALVGLLLVLSVPSSALQIVVTRQVAARHQGKDGEPVPILVGPLLANTVIWSVVTTAVLVAAAPLLKSFLHLSSITSAVLLGLFVLPMALELVPKGVLLGEMRFARVAVSLVAGAVVRVALAYPLTKQRGIEGAMAATVLGTATTAAILLPSLRQFMKIVPGVTALRIHWRDGTGAISAFAGYWMLVTIDTVMARHLLSPTGSGFYAAASLAARSVMFLPAAVATVAFSRFASAQNAVVARKSLVHALVIVCSLGLISATAFAVFPGVVVGTLFPSAYGKSDSVLGLLALSSASVGALFVLMHFHLATHARLAANASWLAVGSIIVGTSLFHDSLNQIATTALVSNLLVAMLIALPIFRPTAQPSRHAYPSRELWESPEATVDVTMVVPYYNPGQLLVPNVKRIIATLSDASVSFEIITVSDGSTDNSDADLHSLDERVRVVRLEKNQGKGAALRMGLAMGNGRYIGFIDSDGDIAPESLAEFMALVRLYSPDVILGSKRHPMSEVHYPAIRRIYSWSYQQLVRLMFGLNLKDTQTGLKLIRREVLADVLPRMIEKRFAFDLELFVVGRHLGYKKYFEAPVRIKHQFTSTVSWRATYGTLLDSLAIFYRLHILRFYDAVYSDTQEVNGPGAANPVD